MRTALWPAVVATAAILSLTAGCASSPSPAAATSHKPSPSATPSPSLPSLSSLQTAIAAANAGATSVHVSGQGVYQGGAISMNASMTAQGDVSGSIGVQRLRIRILALGSRVYIKATAALFRQENVPPAACAALCGKWLQDPGPMKQAVADVGWANLVKRTQRHLAKATFSLADRATVNGQAAWKLNGLGGGAIYVASQGPAYLLEISGGGTQLFFSQWNSATIPPPPPASQVVNLSQYGM